MINNPDCQKSIIKPHLHQITMDGIENLVDCMGSIDIEEMDCDTCGKLCKST
ncbi:MAG: hypothetical protein GQ468_04765 [Candidatus Scalindua sp.]|nr:hypothetical protein [Candidatus Scalindua sp.]